MTGRFGTGTVQWVGVSMRPVLISRFEKTEKPTPGFEPETSESKAARQPLGHNAR
jgi:hypothetical protein